MSRRLDVLLHGHLAGHLADAADGGVDFRLVDSYRELVPRPVLGQKFEDDLERVHHSRKGQGLPDFFANLIPEEGRLRQLIEQAADLETGDDLGLLAYVGEDLPGAVVVRDAETGELPGADQPLRLPLAAPVPAEAEEGLRFSLAGVQLKFSMLLAEEKLTLPGKDRSGEWIVKFDSPTYPHLPENEYSILQWARHAGFDVPDCELRDVDDVIGLPRRYAEDGTKVLVVRRYDRTDEGRVHQEDFAQAVGLPPTKKYDHVTYEKLALLAASFIDGEEAVDELVRRLALVVASGNNDAHLKNWSLIYPEQVQAQWSPLYDQVATVAWKTSRELSLKLAGAKEFHSLDRKDFQRFATKVRRDPRRILDTVDATLQRLHEAWTEIHAELPLPRPHAEALRHHWRSVPLLRQIGSLA